MEYRLHESAKFGEVENLERLLNSGGRVNTRDNNNCTLLHIAVLNRQTSYVKYLLDIAPHLALIKNDTGRTALHCACHPILGLDMIKLLVTVKESLEITNDDAQRTPLHLVSSNPEGLGVMQVLLAAGANINAVNDKGHSVLSSAITSGNTAIVKLLLESGATTKVQDFMKVNLRDNWSVMKVLLEYLPQGVNCANSDGYTLLMRVAMYGDVEHLMELLKFEVDINKMSDHGTTALSEAVKSQDVRKVQVLFDNGADPLIEDKDGYTVLSLVCCGPNTAEMFNTLAAHPAFSDVNFRFHTENLHPLRLVLRQKRSPGLLAAILSSRFSDPNIIFDVEYSNEDNLLSFFGNLSLSPISYLLHNPEGELITNQNMFLMLKLLLDAGYPVDNINGTIPPLTVLLSCNADEISDPDMHKKMFDLLVKRRAPISTISLEELPPDSAYWANIQYLRTHTFLPDALLMAAMCRHMDIVDELLCHWAAPPLAVLLITNHLNTLELYERFYQLAQHGIPCGTEIYRKLLEYLPEVTPPPFRFVNPNPVSVIISDFTNLSRQPRSLQEMCKFATRLELARVATQRGSTLPEEISRHAPPGLKEYLLLKVPESCVPEAPKHVNPWELYFDVLTPEHH